MFWDANPESDPICTLKTKNICSEGQELAQTVDEWYDRGQRVKQCKPKCNKRTHKSVIENGMYLCKKKVSKAQLKRRSKLLGENYIPNLDNYRFLEESLRNVRYPSLDLHPREYIRQITETFKQFEWAVPNVKNSCKDRAQGAVTYSKTQDFIRHYMTPRSPHKGLLINVDAGGGKTCTAVSLTTRFKNVIWVAPKNIIGNVWRSMSNDLCSGIFREWVGNGLNVPTDVKEKMEFLKAHGSRWITPLSYRQLGNALKRNPNQLGNTLRKRSENGDPLYETVIVIDESHLMYDGSLNANQLPPPGAIENAIQTSHGLSGNKSVKVVLLTATPSGSPSIMFKQLNLLFQHTKDFPAFPTNAAAIMHEFKGDKGNVSGIGASRFLKRTMGLVSYLNAQTNASKFAQIFIRDPIDVLVSDVQSKAVAKCLSSKAKNTGTCIRNKLNVAVRHANHAFDHPKFGDGKDLWDNLENLSPRFLTMLQNIQELDERDTREYGNTYKHIIFSDLKNGFGAKFIASALISTQLYTLIIKKKQDQAELEIDATKVDGTRNIALLSTISMFRSGHSRLKLSSDNIEQIIDRDNGIFNDKRNAYGGMCQILVLDSKFGVGIDATDVKYVHFFNPQISDSIVTQVEGRATRYCGSTNLWFTKDIGWKVHSFTYEGEWASASDKAIIGDGLDPFKLAVEEMASLSSEEMLFNNEMANLLITSSVDWNLNAAVNLGQKMPSELHSISDEMSNLSSLS
jgi:hypothetical protein